MQTRSDVHKMIETIRPARLKKGDTIALITPAFQIQTQRLRFAIERMQALGFKVVYDENIQAEDGYFAGNIADNVNAIHQAFLNPEVKAIVCARGGFGSARLLPHLDYDLIRNHPKVVLGFSDITALLIGIYVQTGLITFHGPTANWPLSDYSLRNLMDVLFHAKACQYGNPEVTNADDIIQTKHRVTMLSAGKATGRLVGGNLTVLCSMIGSDYLPQKTWHDNILFIEDIGEDVYRIDRMLVQLQLCGILSQIRGLILGQFVRCDAKAHRSYPLEKVLRDRLAPFNIPVIMGAMIGHSRDTTTLPVGMTASLDAEQGTFYLHEAAVH